MDSKGDTRPAAANADCKNCPYARATGRPGRSMKVVFDAQGRPWLCSQDASIDTARDLRTQGCWRHAVPVTGETDSDS